MNPSLLAVASHCALALLLCALLVRAVAHAGLRPGPCALALAGWLLLSYLLARSGWFLHFESAPPRAVFLLGPGALLAAILALGPFGRRLLEGLPLAWLVGYQAFRIAVELLLWRLCREGLLPVQMTFEGANFDVASGALAIPVAVLLARGKCPGWLLWAWNVGALLLLVNIVVIAVRSMPGPWRAYAAEPANTIVLSGVFVWIPALYVLAAWFGHVLVFRALLRPRS